MKKYIATLILPLIIIFILTACDANGNIEPEATYEPAPYLTYESTYEAQPQTKENPSNIITTRFYYHDKHIDPNLEGLSHAFFYRTVDIPAENFEEVFIREFYRATGINIIRTWFVAPFEYRYEPTNIRDKFYVNLHEDIGEFFGGMSYENTKIYLAILEKTILSLPDINSFEVLVGWKRGVTGPHFNFNHIAYVENGQVVDRVWLNLYAPDDSRTLPNSKVATVFANGAEFSAVLFTAHGYDHPTHIQFLWAIANVFSWEIINTGAQSAIFRNGESIANIHYVNYEYFMFSNLHNFDTESLEADHAFISMNNNTYLPFSLFESMGYAVDIRGNDVYIELYP